MIAGLPLWLLRHNHIPVALVAAPDRAGACRVGHTNAPEVAYCDFSALHLGASKVGFPGLVADLRVNPPDHDALPPLRKTRRANVNRKPSPDAPQAGIATFEALCAHFNLGEGVVRNSQSPVATRMRWALWSVMLEAGYNQKQAASVTGHDHATVSKVMIGLETGTLGVNDDRMQAVYKTSAAAMYSVAKAAMLLATTGNDTAAETAAAC